MKVTVIAREPESGKILRVEITTEAGARLWVTEAEQGHLYLSNQNSKVGVLLDTKGVEVQR